MVLDGLINNLLDRLADQARDAGRLEREKDICAIAAQETAAELEKIRSNTIKVSPTSVEALLNAAKNGMKINAIREIRAMTGIGLKESKDMFERVYPATSSY